jgi:hypothetical protein
MSEQPDQSPQPPTAAPDHRPRLVRSVVIGFTIIVAAIALDEWITRESPLEQEVLAAQSMEFLGVDYPSDGGSKVFCFRLDGVRPLFLLIHHRSGKSGGDPEYQAIWIEQNDGFEAYVNVREHSKLEKKIVALLQSAEIKPDTNARFAKPSHSPTQDKLSWAIERIRDRKSKW